VVPRPASLTRFPYTTLFRSFFDDAWRAQARRELVGPGHKRVLIKRQVTAVEFPGRDQIEERLLVEDGVPHRPRLRRQAGVGVGGEFGVAVVDEPVAP